MSAWGCDVKAQVSSVPSAQGLGFKASSASFVPSGAGNICDPSEMLGTLLEARALGGYLAGWTSAEYKLAYFESRSCSCCSDAFGAIRTQVRPYALKAHFKNLANRFSGGAGQLPGTCVSSTVKVGRGSSDFINALR